MDDAPTPPLTTLALADFMTATYGGEAWEEARRRAFRRQDSKYRDVAEIWRAVCEEIARRRAPQATGRTPD